MTADRLFETTSIPGHLAPTPERLERLLSKQTLEELYEVEEQPFARGKYATVRRCRERASGRQWAAKFLKKRRRAQELKAEALHEVAVLDAAAHCPQLVTLHQVFETNTEMVLVLELASGGELQMVLDRDEVPEERQVVRLLRQILDGIAFLHSHNVAHLDIKPQNLVLTGDFPDCDVKLCDFGISRYISHGADIREILGTPDYVAPEVLNYESISLATDMWSVGVLLYVLLTGCSPFGGDTKQETFCNISRCRLDFPDDLFEDVSEEARDLMQKLMVKDPSKRLTVTECLQHPWLTMCIDPQTSVTLTTNKIDEINDEIDDINNGIVTSRSEPIITLERCSTPEPVSTVDKSPIITEIINENEDTDSPINNKIQTTTTASSTTPTTTTTTTTIYNTKQRSPTMPLRIGLSPDRRDTFKRNMDSLAQKFSSGAEIVIIEQTNNTQRRAIGNHTMPTGEVFKCTPVFILGEEQQCSDSSSDTVSEISTDSSSDRSSIYSDDSLDFILYGKNQGRSSYPFSGIETDRWDHRHTRAWPRECNGVVSKALSRFTTEPIDSKINNNNTNNNSTTTTTSSTSATTTTTVSLTSKAKTGLEALRERGGNLVVIREPVRAGRYTRYSEVQCESVQARIRRFQIQGGS
ncbi:death-associated protein kinase related-like [Aphidius gifuensis]|uniref:death-associated protein kinase related-like n=1 Tax=Aphidius gifuensis TaxID=684658 RepID=UPI001CDD5511|nr:death-associated protein kinase related-like [Aphidius gifuensis]